MLFPVFGLVFIERLIGLVALLKQAQAKNKPLFHSGLHQELDGRRERRWRGGCGVPGGWRGRGWRRLCGETGFRSWLLSSTVSRTGAECSKPLFSWLSKASTRQQGIINAFCPPLQAALAPALRGHDLGSHPTKTPNPPQILLQLSPSSPTLFLPPFQKIWVLDCNVAQAGDAPSPRAGADGRSCSLSTSAPRCQRVLGISLPAWGAVLNSPYLS